mgnify:CR=1 FL=1|jgi:hypothetical protein
MSKRFKQVKVQHFASLVQELKIDVLTQEEFVNAVEEIYMAIFRHNTNGDFVVPTMPNEEGTWKVHNKGQTIEQAMEIINERK